MQSKIKSWFFFNDEKKDHVKALDGLRGLAVILVLLSHSSNHGIYFHKIIGFNGIGKGGVYLFFILSAYLLDRQISLALMNHMSNSFFWFRYFIRRFLRIYPLFIISLIVFWILSYAGLTTTIVHLTDIFEHIFLMEGTSVFWSIPVEFKYYLLSPLILLVCHHFLKWDLKKIALFFTIVCVMMLTIDTMFEMNKISTWKYILIFLTGTYLAVFNISVRPPEWISRRDRWIGLSGFIALLICMIMSPNYLGDWLGISDSNNGRKVMVIYAFLFGIMLFAALYNNRFFRRFLENTFLRFIGVISFSVYLFHMPVLYFIDNQIIFLPEFMKIYFFFGATILISIISYLLIERPLSQINISRRTLLPSGSPE